MPAMTMKRLLEVKTRSLGNVSTDSRLPKWREDLVAAQRQNQNRRDTLVNEFQTRCGPSETQTPQRDS
jgi:glucose/arabinose dehydrogenase